MSGLIRSAYKKPEVTVNTGYPMKPSHRPVMSEGFNGTSFVVLWSPSASGGKIWVGHFNTQRKEWNVWYGKASDFKLPFYAVKVTYTEDEFTRRANEKLRDTYGYYTKFHSTSFLALT